MGEKRPLTVGLAIADEDLREQARYPLRNLGVRILLDQAEPVESLHLKRLNLDLLLIDASTQDELLEEMVRRIKTVAPATMLAVVHKSPDPEVMLTAMRAGTDEFILPPIEDRLRAAVDRISLQIAKRDSGARSQGKVVGFVSAKGGCGATSVACHVASEFQRATQHEILLADFDLESGLVAFLMQAATRYSIIDALKNAYRLDQSLWKGFVWSSGKQLDVMPAPAGLGQPDAETVEFFREVFRLVRSIYGWVLVDLGRGVSQITLKLLDDLDELYLVTTPSITALYQAKQFVKRMMDLGYPRHQLHLVLNRVPRRIVSAEEIQRSIGIPVYAELYDRPELDEAFTAGKLISPDTELGKQFTALAFKIAGVKLEDKAKGWGSLFGAKKVAPGYQEA